MLNSDYKEIFRLKAMLEERGVGFRFLERWERLSKYPWLGFSEDNAGYQIVIPNLDPWDPNVAISIIEGKGSYGAEQDLLEIMDSLTKTEEEWDEIVGWLTAEDVLDRLCNYQHERLMEGDLNEN